VTLGSYSFWVAATTAEAPGVFAWTVLAVLFVLSGLGGWAVSDAMKKQWRQGEQKLSTTTAATEPDLKSPSTSPEALAEVAELEILWRQSVRRRRASSD
jgi:hypothetical protein